MIVYLAGVVKILDYMNFTEEELKDIKQNCYILESFFYCKNETKHIREWDKEHFILDSGAFTFKYNKKDALTDWWKYVDDYCNYIIDNDIKYFFEMDIDNLVGYEKVKEFRRYIENKTQRKCIPVWHISRGKEDYIEMCKNYDYVAIGGITGKEVKKTRAFIEKYLDDLIYIAHKNGARIHLLGYTVISKFDKHKQDSVDSTSWLSGGRFGSLYKFDGEGLRKVDVPKVKGRRLNARRSNRFNFYEWYKFQKYAKDRL